MSSGRDCDAMRVGLESPPRARSSLFGETALGQAATSQASTHHPEARRRTATDSTTAARIGLNRVLATVNLSTHHSPVPYTRHGHDLQSTAPCAARTHHAPDARLPHRLCPSSYLCHSHHPRGQTRQACRPGRAGQRGPFWRRCQHERPLPRPIQDLGPAIEEAVQRPIRRLVGPPGEEELRRARSRGEHDLEEKL